MLIALKYWVMTINAFKVICVIKNDCLVQQKL